jgi:Bacterial EndoU nuclease
LAIAALKERFSKMQIERAWTLDAVKADWARVKCEVAWVRMLFAARDYRLAVERSQKFNPYHDYAGRFTTSDGDTGGGAGSDTLVGGDRAKKPSAPSSGAPIVVAANDGPKILGRGARDFGQRVNTPSPKDINVRMGHIVDNHTVGGLGFRTSTRDGGNKDMFPERMTHQDIERAVREAYSNSREVSSPRYNPNGKIRELEGESEGLTIRMFYNSDTKTIDSAFPQ